MKRKSGMDFSSAANCSRKNRSCCVREVLQRSLHTDLFAGEVDAYSCGPTPMIDAVLPVLQLAGVEPEHIQLDKFTPALR